MQYLNQYLINNVFPPIQKKKSMYPALEKIALTTVKSGIDLNILL